MEEQKREPIRRLIRCEGRALPDLICYDIELRDNSEIHFSEIKEEEVLEFQQYLLEQLRRTTDFMYGLQYGKRNGWPYWNLHMQLD